MIRATKETKEYEDRLLLSLTTSSIPEEVQKVRQHGVVYKRGGIKSLIEWEKRKGPWGRVLEVTFFSSLKVCFNRG